MQTGIAVISIIVENKGSMESINGPLHQCSQYIIGGLGLPYKKKKVDVIGVVVDAPQDIMGTLSDKLGRFQGIDSKALCSNIGS